jgi:hypothetical protein
MSSQKNVLEAILTCWSIVPTHGCFRYTVYRLREISTTRYFPYYAGWGNVTFSYFLPNLIHLTNFFLGKSCNFVPN